MHLSLVSPFAVVPRARTRKLGSNARYTPHRCPIRAKLHFPGYFALDSVSFPTSRFREQRAEQQRVHLHVGDANRWLIIFTSTAFEIQKIELCVCSNCNPGVEALAMVHSLLCLVSEGTYLYWVI